MKQLRYMGEFLSRHSVVWRVEILQEADAPFGQIGNLDFDAQGALRIEWPETSKEDVICGSSATIRIISPGDRTYEDLYTIEVGRIRMDVYRNGRLYWSGTLDPEFYEEPYERLNNYTVSLTFSDLGILARRKYSLTGLRTFEEILSYCIGQTEINHISLEYDELLTTYFTDDTKAGLQSLAVRSDNFIDEDGEAESLKGALEGILRPLALRIMQRNGHIWVYDLNGLYHNAPSRLLEWNGDSQTMGVDKVANNVRVTFSPYAASGNMVQEVEFLGKYSSDIYSLAGAVDAEGTEYYSFYPDYSESHRQGSNWDYRLISFTIFHNPTKGSGLAHISPRAAYAHILPMVNGPQECDCVMWGYRTGGHGALTSGYPRPKGNIANITKGTDHVVMRTGRVFLPKLSAEDASRYYIRLRLEFLLDARYNPFSGSTEGNEETNDNLLKADTGFAFVPVAVGLFDEDGFATAHYCNRPIAESASCGHLGYAKGTWEEGAASFGEAWLEYYNPEDLRQDCGVRGWKNNRHCIGRPDQDFRKNSRYGCADGFYIYDSFKQMPEGEYIPYPPQGGYLEVSVYEGVRCFDYGEEPEPIDDNGTWRSPTPADMFRITRAWTNTGLYDKLRWMMYKAPQIEIVRSNLVFDSVGMDDVEYSGYLNKAAKDDITLETVCGTATAVCPTARGIICRAPQMEQLTLMRRAAVTDHPEKLLIGTLYSQFASRRTRLEGEAEIDCGNLCTFTERNQPGKKFILVSDNQDCITDTSDAVIIELRPDEYEAIEEL